MKYYIHNGEKQLGPFSLEELKTESITKNTSIWHEGLNDWTKAESIKELDSLFTSVPPAFRNQQKQVKRNPQSSRLILVLFVAIIIGAWISNPNVDQHRAMASIKLNEKLDQLKTEITPKKKFWKIVKEVSFALSSGLLQEQIRQRIWSDDYYLCSLTKVKLKNRDVTVGFGAFGNVWLITDSVNSINAEELID